MAACSFGASIIKLSSLSLGNSTFKVAPLLPLHGPIYQKNVGYGSLVLSNRPGKTLFRCRCMSKEQPQTHLDDGFNEDKPSGSVSRSIPNALQVESLITDICDTSSIAEFELKLGGFRLYVTRDLSGKNETPPLQVSAPVTSADVPAPALNGSASSTSLAISKPVQSSGGIQSFIDKAADDGLVILQSPKVGYFRRSRTIKGKRAPPSCKEKQIVKEGQVVCFIEQLGGEIPVESETSGEVIKILREDGDPVGYGDALVAILPSFPGIKKLQQ